MNKADCFKIKGAYVDLKGHWMIFFIFFFPSFFPLQNFKGNNQFHNNREKKKVLRAKVQKIEKQKLF